ncbi:MAG: chloride channel protein [Ruminococcus sp.]|nr:chloride channel protein [Ruminococcus sp.]
MPEILKNAADEIRREELPELKSLCKWLVYGTISGLIIGLIGTFFHLCSSSAEFFREQHPWVLFFLPLAGAAIAMFYDAMNYSHDKGTNLVLLAVRDNKVMGIHHAVCIFVAAVITHLFGGSSGREGASLQIGAALGSFTGRKLKFNEHDKRIMTMCCMSAMFAAVFGTPAAAALFSMEVVSVGIFYYSAIVPCAAAALTASWVSSRFGISHIAVSVTFPSADPVSFLRVAVLGALCALLSVVFCASMSGTLKLFRHIKNHMLRAAAGGALVVLLTLAAGDQTYNGTGGAFIVSAFSERPFVLAFAVKLIFTVITLGSGYKGGEIFPVFFIGSAFGSVMSAVLGLPLSAGAAVGMISLFCGVTNCPVASFVLGIELFGSGGLPFCLLACAVSYMLSGYRGLYSEQRIVYSKRRTKYINKRIGDEK